MTSASDTKQSGNAQEDASASSNSGLLVSSCGIIFSLAIYGYLQERIMAIPYGDNEFFKDTVFLVLNNRVVAGLCGLVCVLYKRENLFGGTPIWHFSIIAGSNYAATWCQYEALKYVSFPTQTIGKAMKTVPVMVMGRIVSGTKYQMVQWSISWALTAGILMFLLTGSISSKRSKKGASDDSSFGLMLICAYLVFDAFAPVMQERILGSKKSSGAEQKTKKSSRYVAMFWTNLSSGVVSIAYLSYAGTLKDAIAFSTRNPSFIIDATLLSICASVNQFCIYATIAHPNGGALVLAIVMNVRLVFQVVVSMVMYNHMPSSGQVGGLCIIVAALFYKVHFDAQKKKLKALSNHAANTEGEKKEK